MTDPYSPISLVLQLSFKDESNEPLAIRYGGNPPIEFQEAYASHTNPQALLRWYSNDPYIILLAETPQSG